MYRIAEMNFEGALRFEPDRIYATLPAELTDAQIAALKAAKVVEILDDGDQVIASYDLVNWAAIENTGEAISMSWFRYNMQKLDVIEQTVAGHTETLSNNAVELSDILDAIVELGDLIAQVIPEGE